MVLAGTFLVLVACTSGIVLVLASVQKLDDFDAFNQTVSGLGIPAAPSTLIATLFPAVEFATGGLLISGQEPQAAAILGVIVTGGLTLVSVYAGLTNIRIACNCFGRVGKALGWSTFPLAVLLFGCQCVY